MKPALHTPIFVISLADSGDRRARMSGALTGLGLDFEFFDAVDGRNGFPSELDRRVDDPAIRARMGRDMSGAEKGCALSHSRLYQEILDRELPFAIVLEDDMVPTPAFRDLVLSGSLEGSDFELILLYYSSSHAFKWSFQPCFARHRYFRFAAQPNSAGAYFLTSEAAAQLAEATRPITFVADWPILIAFRMRCAGVYPPVMQHSQAPSLLNEERSRLNFERKSRALETSPSVWGKIWKSLKARDLKSVLDVLYFHTLFRVASVQVAGTDQENAVEQPPNLTPQHVVFCCSGSSGLVFLAVAARSLFESHSNPVRLRVHVIFEHLEQTDINRLQQSWKPWSTTNQVFFYRMSDYLGERALDPSYGYWFRVWMHKVLPGDIERVLYLDNDLIVLRDVSELWQIDLQNRLGAMAEDPGSTRVKPELAEFAKSLGMDYDLGCTYFNTGVMLINLDRWRARDVGAALDDKFLAHRPHSYHFDQGELNLLYSEDFGPLPGHWNVIHHPVYDLLHAQSLESPVSKISIRHFAGPSKVTDKWRRLGEKKVFYDVLDRTAWRGWRSAEDKSAAGRLLSQLLEYRYLVNSRSSYPDYRKRLFTLILLNPALPFIAALIPLLRRARRFIARNRGLSCPSNT